MITRAQLVDDKPILLPGVMLTGQADDETLLRTVGATHRFVAKPAASDAFKISLLCERWQSDFTAILNTGFHTPH